MPAHTMRQLGVCLAAASLAFSLTACADDGTAPGVSTETDAAKNMVIDAELGRRFTGSTGSGEADGSPISLGVVNQQGGTVSNPEFTVAVQAAADYVNNELGGVGGHPLKLVTCNIVSAESQGQGCGQQMLAESSVPLVIQGGLNVGAQSLHATINGAKPVLIAQANPGPDATAKNAYAVNASALAAIAGTGPYLKTVLKARTAAMIVDDNPGDQAIAKILKDQVEAQGIKVKVAGYPAGSTDLVTPLTAAGAQTADVILPLAVTSAGCIATAKAYEQLALTTPLLSAGLCASATVKQQLGDYPKWHYSASYLNLDATDMTGQVAFYKAVMAKYAPEGAEISVNAPLGFSGLLAAVKILNDADPDKLTADTVSAAAGEFTGPTLLGPPEMKFGSVPGQPAIGSLASRVYKYEGESKWAASGDWVMPGSAGGS